MSQRLQAACDGRGVEFGRLHILVRRSADREWHRSLGVLCAVLPKIRLWSGAMARARRGAAQGHGGAGAAATLVTGRWKRAEMTALATTLVLGGTRSGKSAFAEKMIGDSGLARIYLAAATADDDEMRNRIVHHRAQRGEGWVTIEEPLSLVDALTREATHGRAVLVD